MGTEKGTPMKTNLGSYDVGARYLGGCLTLLVGVHLESWWGAIGLIPLVTACVGCCPLYIPFGWDTTRYDEN